MRKFRKPINNSREKNIISYSEDSLFNNHMEKGYHYLVLGTVSRE